MMEHIMQPNASLYCSRISRSLCDSHNCQQTSIPPCAAVWCQQYQMHRSPTILQPWRGDIKQHSGCHIHPKKPRCQLKLTSLPPTFVSLPLSVPSACFTLFFPRQSPQSGSHLHPGQYMQSAAWTRRSVTPSHLPMCSCKWKEPLCA